MYTISYKFNNVSLKTKLKKDKAAKNARGSKLPSVKKNARRSVKKHQKKRESKNKNGEPYPWGASPIPKLINPKLRKTKNI